MRSRSARALTFVGFFAETSLIFPLSLWERVGVRVTGGQQETEPC
ncbi:MAG: hypothetical protein QUS66_10340 [Bacteroidota bacterium]|nr:hypothetical protein [Bacteroidota bacterium]